MSHSKIKKWVWPLAIVLIIVMSAGCRGKGRREKDNSQTETSPGIETTLGNGTTHTIDAQEEHTAETESPSRQTEQSTQEATPEENVPEEPTSVSATSPDPGKEESELPHQTDKDGNGSENGKGDDNGAPADNTDIDKTTPEEDEKYLELQQEITLKEYDGGFFSIKIPEGWDLNTAGEYSTFSFVARDPDHPLRQVFYFGAVGPFYINKEQKDADAEFIEKGGYVAWSDMPVIDPLTVTNLFLNYEELITSRIASTFMTGYPELSEFEAISSKAVEPVLRGCSSELVRGLFKKDGKLGEGLFLAGVAPFMPYTGAPMGGNAFGIMVTGVTAPEDEFKYIGKILIQVLESFTVSAQYINEGRKSQQVIYPDILKEGKALAGIADTMNRGFESMGRED